MKSKFYMALIVAFFLFASFKSFSQANTTLSNLVSPTSANQDLLPNSNNILNLGSVSKSWKTLYIDNNIYLKDSLFLNAKGTQNTFVGQRAGYDISTGSNNAAYGFHALYNNTTGGYNSAFGSSALANNTGASNSAFGYRALYNNTTGTANTATGRYALYQNTTGNNNVATGYQSLYANTTGLYNTAAGYSSLYANTIGIFNTVTGFEALYNNTTGNNNIANGAKALFTNTTGYSNVAIGIKALYNSTTGNQYIAIGDSALYNQITPPDNYAQNVAIGSKALYSNTTGFLNTAIGFNALYANITGSLNIATGYRALYSNTTGNYNTATGYSALYLDTSGYGNTAYGLDALYANTTGIYNTAIGYNAGSSHSGLYNSTALGANVLVDADNKVRVGDEQVTSIGGQVGWTSFSDGRYKKNIKQDVQGLGFINSLQPITYTVDINALNEYFDKGRKHDSSYERTKADMKDSADKASKIIYNGFIAQDVEKAAAKLNYNFSGVDKPQSKDGLYGLRYADFVVPLVKAVQELSKQNDSLKNNVAKQQQINTDLESRLSKLEAIMNVSSQSTLVSSASLAQNVPNPFTNSTSITYNLPQSYSSAKIIITDKKGVALKQINLNTKGKGNVNVNASTLAAGAYQYSLYVNERLSDTKQMVLNK